MSFTAITPRLLKVRPRRGGGVASYFGADVTAVEAAVADAFLGAGITGRAGLMAATESSVDILNALGTIEGATTFVPDFWISTTGAGSASTGGTQANPWPITMLGDSAAQARYRGRKVGVLPGTYNISGLTSGSAQYPLFKIPAGTPGSPTVIRSTTKLGAVLDLKSAGGVRNGRAAIGDYGSGSNGNIEIYDFVIRGGALSGVQFYYYDQGNAGVVVEGCEIYDIAGPNTDNYGAVWLQGVLNARVRRNHIHHVTNSGGTHNAAAVIYWASRGTIIESNDVHDCPSAFYDKNAPAAGMRPNEGSIVRYNYIHDVPVAMHGFDNAFFGNTAGFRPFDPHRVHNNLFENVHVVLDSEQGGRQHHAPFYFYNNTIKLTAENSTDSVVNMATDVAGGAYFYNNILVGGAAVGFYGNLGFSVGGWTLSNFNSFSTANFRNTTRALNNPDSSPTNYATLSAWRAITGNPDAQSITTAPTFAGGTGAAAYKLASGPHIGGGRVGGLIGGAACNMGCYSSSDQSEPIGEAA